MLRLNRCLLLAVSLKRRREILLRGGLGSLPLRLLWRLLVVEGLGLGLGGAREVPTEFVQPLLDVVVVGLQLSLHFQLMLLLLLQLLLVLLLLPLQVLLVFVLLRSDIRDKMLEDFVREHGEELGAERGVVRHCKMEEGRKNFSVPGYVYIYSGDQLSSCQ